MKQASSIASHPNILSGTLVITGTRIPVSRIFYLLSQGYTIENIRKEYPQLSSQKIKTIIAEIAKQAENGAFLHS